MKNLDTNNAHKAPESDQDEAATPEIILRGLIGMFTDPKAPDTVRDAARELDLALMLDPSAEHDLLEALGCQGLVVGTPAGFDCMMALLEKVGAVERKPEPGQTELFWLRFDARPLLGLLKAMPHRDPGLGLRRELLDSCTEETDNNDNPKH